MEENLCLDTQKSISPNIPFFSVHREIRGVIDTCAKPDTYSCILCLFKKSCVLYKPQITKQQRKNTLRWLDKEVSKVDWAQCMSQNKKLQEEILRGGL
jgi:hypothetical protein